MENNRKKILGISGSIRKNSSNERILRLIGILNKERIDLSLFEGIDQLPHFNPDLDNEDLLPQTVRDFRNKIEAADGVIFCTPEYVFSLPGALKSCIEWTVSTTVFSHKPVAMIVAAGAGEKAFESLGLILTTIEARIEKGAALLIKGARSKLTDQGSFSDPGILEEINKLVDALLDSIRFSGK